MKKIIIIGSSGHAKVIIDIITKNKQYKIVGLIDDFKKVGEKILNYKVLGGIKDIDKLIKIHKANDVIIGVGDNFSRYEIANKLKKCSFATVIHPSAQIGLDVKIGAGTVIASGANIGPCSEIGEHCILNTNSSLDHDGIMGDFSSLAPGATTGGNVKIGRLTSICLGANIIQKMEIGENTIIGASSCVLNSIENDVLAYGIPCKVIRKRKLGDKYL